MRSLLCGVCLGFTLFNGPPAFAQIHWYPASEKDMSCSIGSQIIDFGTFSHITNPTPRVPGSFSVNCHSNVYQSGYPSTYSTVAGGYCLTISHGNGQSPTGKDRYLIGDPGGLKLPFSFKFSNGKPFEDSYHQDYNSPIGDGAYGIPYIDWNYYNCQVGKYFNNPSTKGPYDGAKAQGSACDLPNYRGKIDAQISQYAAAQVWPAGTYEGDFPFYYHYGVTTISGHWPEPGDSRDCSQWPQGGGTGNIHVVLKISKYCSIANTKAVDFGTQAYFDEPHYANGAITVQCSDKTKFQLGINDGLHNPDGQQRYMTLNNDEPKAENQRIPYNLYQDSAYSVPWGNVDTANVYTSKEATGDAVTSVSIPVYAKIPVLADQKTTGSYKDTVIVTVKVIDDGLNRGNSHN